MTEEQLTQLLREQRPQAPVAPATEWQGILERVHKPSLWQRFWQPWPALALGGAMTAALFVALPLQSPEPMDDATLILAMLDAGQELGLSQAKSSTDAGAGYLELLEQVQ